MGSPVTSPHGRARPVAQTHGAGRRLRARGHADRARSPCTLDPAREACGERCRTPGAADAPAPVRSGARAAQQRGPAPSRSPDGLPRNPAEETRSSGDERTLLLCILAIGGLAAFGATPAFAASTAVTQNAWFQDQNRIIEVNNRVRARGTTTAAPCPTAAASGRGASSTSGRSAAAPRTACTSRTTTACTVAHHHVHQHAVLPEPRTDDREHPQRRVRLRRRQCGRQHDVRQVGSVQELLVRLPTANARLSPSVRVAGPGGETSRPARHLPSSGACPGSTRPTGGRCGRRRTAPRRTTAVRSADCGCTR